MAAAAKRALARRSGAATRSRGLYLLAATEGRLQPVAMEASHAGDPSDARARGRPADPGYARALDRTPSAPIAARQTATVLTANWFTARRASTRLYGASADRP